MLINFSDDAAAWGSSGRIISFYSYTKRRPGVFLLTTCRALLHFFFLVVVVPSWAFLLIVNNVMSVDAASASLSANPEAAAASFLGATNAGDGTSQWYFF